MTSDTRSVSASGPIVALISGGFTINGGKGVGHLHIYITSSTTISGPKPAVGLYAQATGTGSFSTSLTATSVTISSSTNSPATSASPIPLQTNKITVTGKVSGAFSGGFTVYAGSKVGYLHVYTNSSTLFAGGTPKAGLYAQSTGTGSLKTSVTAGYVALYASAPASVTVSGTAISATSYGFTENAGSTYPSVPIVMNAATIVGGAPLVAGATVKVTGLGAQDEAVLASSIVVSTPSPDPGATSSPTPAPLSQTHVLTADYLGGPNGSTSIAWSAAAPYLTWAQTGGSNANAVSAAGIKTQLYVDPNRSSSTGGDPFYTSDETMYAHDCSGNRISYMYGSRTMYVMDASSPSLQTYFANYVAGYSSQAHYDAVFEDDDTVLSDIAANKGNLSAMPCNYSDSSWLAGEEALNQVTNVPIVANSLSGLHNDGVSQSMALLSNSSNTIGGNMEDCYASSNQAKATGWYWQTIENTELQTAALNKLFECMAEDTTSAASATDARLYVYASFLLTYNPSTSILWEFYATPSGLRVQPESQLVALDPLVAAPSGVTALQQTGGTYGRQYAHCYLAGNFVGACAVAVNPDGSYSHPFPYPQYTHTLVLSGSGVLDGGTVSTNGGAPPSTLGPGEAAIVFP